jgi:penicillin-binding protein 1C
VKKSRISFILFLPTIAVLGVFYLVMRFSPYADLAAFARAPRSMRFYDIKGVRLQISTVEDGLHREVVRLEDIPPALVDAILLSEDDAFYVHPGINPIAVARAAAKNFATGRIESGASTITMQLARIIALRAGKDAPQTLSRKMREAINALRLEARYSKQEILTMYINSLPFGHRNEGVASASRGFFALALAPLHFSLKFGIL